MTEPLRNMSEVQLGPCRLICGDAFDIMPALDQVDVTITDPPYSPRTHKGAMTNKLENAADGHRQGGASLLTFDSINDIQFIALSRECLRLSRRWVVMTCDHRHAALTFDWPEHIRLGVWVKGAPMPQITGDRPGSGHESVLIMHNPGKKRWNRGGGAAVWTSTVLKDNRIVIQPTQKPVPLISAFVRDFTDEGETVLDPFMGSGTTAISCIRAGRNFVGIEKSPTHFAGACERIARELQQQTLAL